MPEEHEVKIEFHDLIVYISKSEIKLEAHENRVTLDPNRLTFIRAQHLEHFGSGTTTYSLLGDADD